MATEHPASCATAGLAIPNATVSASRRRAPRLCPDMVMALCHDAPQPRSLCKKEHATEPEAVSLRPTVRVMVKHRIAASGLLLVVLASVLGHAEASPRAVQSQNTASQTVTISGRILDAHSMAPIAGVRVEAAGRQAVTGPDGTFVITAPRETVTVVVEAEGYLTESRVFEVSPATSSLPVEILLVSRSQFSEEISVTGRTSAVQTPAAATPVSPLEVRSVAGAADNVFRVLQTLPGVAAADEFGSRLTVRGGGPDQNLTMMDGLFGLTSAFNPETVENFELTAGGFSPKYGDRLSSLLVVDNRPGSTTRRVGGTATMGITDANVVLEGKLKGAPGSWLVTGRRTYYDLIIGKIIDQSLPSFGDLQANVTLLPRPGQRLVFTGLYSRENTNAEFDSDDSLERFGLKAASKNDLASASYFTTLGSSTTSKTVLAWYRNADSLDVDGQVNNNSRRSNAPGDPALSKIVFTRDILLRDLSVRQEFSSLLRGKHLLQAGGEFHGLDTRWGWTISGERNTSVANGSSVRGGAGLPSLLDSARATARNAAWLADRWELASRLTVEPGLRADYSTVNREWTVSPRLSLGAEPGGGLRLRAAGGLYTQSPGYEKLLQSDYFVDLTGTGALNLRSERSWHGILSVERNLGAAFVARLEGYVKTFDRMLVGRLETPEQVSARVSAYRFPAELSSSIPATAQVTSAPSNDGSGRATGFDLYVSRRARSSTDRLTGWASYTFGRAHTNAYGRSYPFDYDRRHAFSAVTSYQLSRLLELAVTARLASGFPRPPALGLRVAGTERLDASGATIVEPDRDADGRLVYSVDLGSVDNLNSARLPLFARVDTRLTFRPGWMDRRWQIYLEVINITNRNNAGTLDATLEYDPTGDRPKVVLKREAGIPLLPTFGLRVRF